MEGSTKHGDGSPIPFCRNVGNFEFKLIKQFASSLPVQILILKLGAKIKRQTTKSE
jgi:hypothetical protein